MKKITLMYIFVWRHPRTVLVIRREEGRMITADVFAMADFSTRLRLARKAAGLTQLVLAAHLGVQQGWISRLEAGAMTHVQADTLKRLCVALDVSADYLLGLTDTPSLPPAAQE